MKIILRKFDIRCIAFTRLLGFKLVPECSKLYSRLAAQSYAGRLHCSTSRSVGSAPVKGSGRTFIVSTGFVEQASSSHFRSIGFNIGMQQIVSL